MCKKECAKCMKPKQISQTRWCYDEKFNLPPMAVNAQRFTSQPGARERTVSLEDLLERDRL